MLGIGFQDNWETRTPIFMNGAFKLLFFPSLLHILQSSSILLNVKVS